MSNTANRYQNIGLLKTKESPYTVTHASTLGVGYYTKLSMSKIAFDSKTLLVNPSNSWVEDTKFCGLLFAATDALTESKDTSVPAPPVTPPVVNGTTPTVLPPFFVGSASNMVPSFVLTLAAIFVSMFLC